MLRRGTAVIARPGVGLQFNILPEHAVVLPVPDHVSMGGMLTTITGARLAVDPHDLARQLSYCGLSVAEAEDIVDELTRARVLAPRHTGAGIAVLHSGRPSEALLGALAKIGIAATAYRGAKELIHQVPAGRLALLPGNLFLPSDVLYALMQAGICHYPVGTIDGAVVAGPLVIPGRTPCLTCLDHHYTRQDHNWNSIRIQATSRPVSTDPLHAEAAALMLASIVAEHIIPWQRSGSSASDIPAVLRERLELRLDGAHVASLPIAHEPTCPACAMLREDIPQPLQIPPSPEPQLAQIRPC